MSVFAFRPPTLISRCAVLLIAAAAFPAFAGPRLIVQFHDADVEAAFAPASRVAKLARDTGIEARPLRRMAAGAHLIELAPGTDARAAALAALANGNVRFAVPDRRVHRARVPNDTSLPLQTYLTNDPASVNAFAAWDVTTGAASVVVAVLDTGVLPHPDLAGRFLPGYDFIKDLPTANDGDGRDPDPTDPGDWISQADLDTGNFTDCEIERSSWHGLSVSGVVGANADNGSGVAGLDWGARILPVRVLGKCGGDFSDIFDAIAWAAGLPVPGVPPNLFPAQVLNLSLGSEGEGCTPQEDAFYFAQFLSATGLRAIVAAAGNDGGDADLHFPSSCPSLISVAATTSAGQRTSYSNAGTSVDIAAPGGEQGVQLITVVSNRGPQAAGTYSVTGVTGTSFAAPIVSGVASLMLSVAPTLTPATLRAALVNAAKPFPLGSTCTTATCGHGIVDAHAAVLAAQATPPAGPEVPVVEYFNAGFGHYFMTADADEIAGLDAGAYGGAFLRTGRVFIARNAPGPGTVPVCRFFTKPGTFGAKSSHFYTGDAAECAGLKLNPDWIYEKIAFHAEVPAGGACAAGTVPVYRMYNDGQTAAPNHRFSTETSIYQQFTTTLGWSPEGIRFCAP